MGRPAKAIATKTGKISKDEIEKRHNVEDKIKGNSDKLKTSKRLNKRQKAIFKYILNELKDKDILGNLDLFVLTQAAIAIERLEYLDQKINLSDDFMLSKETKSLRDMYSKDFFRCCNELCLSPQARAKLSIPNEPPKNKTLRDILGEKKE